VCNADLPWARPGARFTLMMERVVIDVLHHAQDVSAARRLLNISWDQAAHVMGRAVERGLARRPAQATRYLGADEKRYRRGHVYATVVSDLEHAAVLGVIDGRRSDSLALFYKGMTHDQRDAIQAVAIDMAAPYEHATRTHLPEGEAKIVYDRFHVMKLTTEALDRVRQAEPTRLRRAGEDGPLKRSRQLWLWSEQNLPAKHRDRLEQLKQLDLQTGVAWSMKEHLRRLWEQPDEPAARALFERWHAWVMGGGLKPMMRVARTLKKRLAGVVRFCRHRLTTAACEGLNSRISAIQHRAAGFRRFDRLRQAILFYHGQLELYP